MERIDAELVRQCANLIYEDFDLKTFIDEEDYDSVLNALTKAIKNYLDSDLNNLLNILYRIDINESEVKKILTTAPPEEMAKQLAEKILRRELQKVLTRQKYRPGASN
ncbi:MAG: hypothetical protein O2887_15605 [Bacteroidetes bacterium]|nr:hypothetical protein [Bacteroidota bacterium]MDA1121889.1 hypothetical protein [Bacteroidota bacterium]